MYITDQNGVKLDDPYVFNGISSIICSKNNRLLVLERNYVLKMIDFDKEKEIFLENVSWIFKNVAKDGKKSRDYKKESNIGKLFNRIYMDDKNNVYLEFKGF